MEEPPVERLLREKEEDAIDNDDGVLVFSSPDRQSTSKLRMDQSNQRLIIETTLPHSTRMIDENIYMASNILAGKFTDDQIHEIIDDISARLKHIQFPKMFEEIKYGFQIIDKDAEYTKFAYFIPYNEELTYDSLRETFETVLMQSFELIYSYFMEMSFFIQTELNAFLMQPEVGLKLLEIRKLLFQAKFYTTMSGRFAGDQRRIAQSMRKEARELLELFEKEFPETASTQVQEIKDFFELS